jgi:hypothetical protein
MAFILSDARRVSPGLERLIGFDRIRRVKDMKQQFKPQSLSETFLPEESLFAIAESFAPPLRFTRGAGSQF